MSADGLVEPEPEADGTNGFKLSLFGFEPTLADAGLEVQGLDLVSGNFDEDVIQVLAFEAGLDLFSVAARDDLAGMDEEDAVADFLDVLHIVLRVQNLQNLAEWFCRAWGEVSGGVQDAWGSCASGAH